MKNDLKINHNPQYSSIHNPLIDLLRGVAVFFLPLSNASHFLIPIEAKISPNYFFELSQGMTAVWFVYHVIIELKLFYLLAIVFGISFAMSQLQSIGRDSSQNNQTTSYELFSLKQYRRAFGLIMLGAIHGLFFWSGDVLLLYGIVFCLLIMLGKFISTPIYLFSIIMMLLVGSYAYNFGAISGYVQNYDWFFKIDAAVLTAYEPVYEPLILSNESNFFINRFQNAEAFLMAISNTFYHYFWVILALFISGVLLVKLGYFHPDFNNSHLYEQDKQIFQSYHFNRCLRTMITNFRYTLFITLPLLVMVSFWQQYIKWHVELGAYYYWYIFEILSMLTVLGGLSMVLYYQASIINAMQKNRVLTFFQRAGRLSLSLYLTQTIILSLLVYGFFHILPISSKYWIIHYNQSIYLILGVLTLFITIILTLCWPFKKGPAEQLMQYYMRGK